MNTWLHRVNFSLNSCFVDNYTFEHQGPYMQRQGNKPPKNKPGLTLNLVLLKLVFKWHAETLV